MEDSILYDLIAARTSKYYDELTEDKNNNFYKWKQEAKEKAEKTLNKEQLDLVDSYIYSANLYQEYIDMSIGLKLLNYGVEIGMQLQKAFTENK